MKRFHTRVFVLLLALVLAIMPNVWAAEPSFEDMPDDWSQPALEAAVDNGLLVGDGQGRINAHRALTGRNWPPSSSGPMARPAPLTCPAMPTYNPAPGTMTAWPRRCAWECLPEPAP